MFIDDLPIWGYIGEVVHEEFLLGKDMQGAKVYLYPHLHFTIGYNNDQVSKSPFVAILITSIFSFTIVLFLKLYF
jgi:hypothetical protein